MTTYAVRPRGRDCSAAKWAEAAKQQQAPYCVSIWCSLAQVRSCYRNEPEYEPSVSVFSTVRIVNCFRGTAAVQQWQ